MTEQEVIIAAYRIRSIRDAELSRSDWTQLSDAPFTNEQKSTWAAYRQQLRDLPEQEDFPDLQFPQKPE